MENTIIAKELLEVSKKNKLHITEFTTEPESKHYKACNFYLHKKKCFYREAKITPKKTGQFVTFWKRNKEGIIEPFHEKDKFDFYIITVRSKNNSGLFLFPKKTLLAKNIISTDTKEGKRGFRVYPAWDIPNNKQATKTQEWQLHYFFELGTEKYLNYFLD